MATVFCRACANELNDTTRFCSKCGAAQSVAHAAAPQAGPVSYARYEDVPVFRKRWFAVFCCLFFSPALLFILFTGDIYLEKDGKVTPIPQYAKIILLVVGALSIIRILMALLR